MPKNMRHDPTHDELNKALNTPSGKQLLQIIKQQDGEKMNAAIRFATEGNFQEAQKSLRDMLTNPQVQALLKQLEDYNG